jgi:hypothetical protein
MLNASKKIKIISAFRSAFLRAPYASAKKETRNVSKEETLQEHFARILRVALAWTVWALEPIALPKTLQ